MHGASDTSTERLIAAARRLRDSGALGRSDYQQRLFQFLLDRTLSGQVPKEFEIGQEVFAKASDFDMMQDASVRVYIHRLRRKLEDYGGRLGMQEDRVVLPLGDYRLVLVPGLSVEEPASDSEQAAGAPATLEPEPAVAAFPPRRSGIGRFWQVALLLLALNAMGWVVHLAVRGSVPGADVASSTLWRPFAENGVPTVLVAGDYYVFGEMADNFNVTRLVRDFSINSEGDLERLFMAHPEESGRYLNLDLHYLPTSIAPALRDLVPVLAAMSEGRRPPQAMTMSKLAPIMLKNANVVYVGFLSGLGLLRDPVLRASGFRIGENYDELVDKASGRRFTSDWGVVVDGKTPQRDYAYISSFPGPTGNHIVVIAGTRDAAVIQAAQIAADPQQLELMAGKAQSATFEALYEVRALGDVNLSSSLVLVRPVRADGIWRPDDPN